MLHILNGDAMLPSWQQARLPGQCLVWREILMEGPLAADLEQPRARQARAGYLEQRFGIPQSRYLGDLEEQDRVLDGCREDTQYVLWFEADLFCHLHLLQLLARLPAAAFSRRQVFLVYADDPGGMGKLTPTDKAELFRKRRTVSTTERSAATAVWRALTSSDPSRLLPMVGTELPVFAARTIQAHMERFPAERSGLSLPEEDILEALDAGPCDPVALFQDVGARPSTARQGMGDLQFFAIIADLAGGESAPVTWTGLLEPFGFETPTLEIKKSRVEMTAAGREILQGLRQREATGLSGGWLGGLQLTAARPAWRRRDAENGPQLVFC